MTESVLFYTAIRLKARKEEFARIELQRVGVHLYVPLLRTVRRQKITTVSLFPGYGFIDEGVVEERFETIRYTRGVIGIMQIGGGPARIEGAYIRFLKSMEGDDGAIDKRLVLREGAEAGIEGDKFHELREAITHTHRFQACRNILEVLGATVKGYCAHIGN